MKVNKKTKINIGFWNQFTNLELFTALALVTPPEKILTLEDFNTAERYIKTHKGFKKILRKAASESEKDTEHGVA